MARWLRDLYPNPGGRYWAALQPDRLAERHVVDVLSASPDLADACLHSLDYDQAVEALTVLARACKHHPAAPGLIAAAVRADLTGLGVPAVRAAVQTGSALGDVLADVVGDVEAPREVLLQIHEAVPFDTVALAEADAILTRRIVETLPDDVSPAERARWDDQLAMALIRVGRPSQALPAAEEAVGAYRVLAHTDPDQFRGDLAGSLQHLGAVFSELGRDANALPLAEEAATIYRQLADTDPGRYLSGLAVSLESIGVWYSRLARLSQALPAALEAVGIWRQLAGRIQTVTSPALPVRFTISAIYIRSWDTSPMPCR